MVLKFFREAEQARWRKERIVLGLMNADAENPAPKLIEAFQLRPDDALAVGQGTVQYVLVLEEGIGADLVSYAPHGLEAQSLHAPHGLEVHSLHAAPLMD